MCDDQAFRDKITGSHESRFARAYHRCTGESVGELLVLRLVVGGGLVFGSTACVGSTAPDQPTDRRERSEDIDRRRCHDRGSREQSPTVCTRLPSPHERETPGAHFTGMSSYPRRVGYQFCFDQPWRVVRLRDMLTRKLWDGRLATSLPVACGKRAVRRDAAVPVPGRYSPRSVLCSLFRSF